LSAHTPAKAAWLVTFTTMLVAFFNWGLGLIFGAILARKIGEAFAQRGEKLNYALIGATGYSGFMVWHGGISGSAPAKVVEPEHLKTMMQGVYTPEQMTSLPSSLPFNMTIFSNMNLFVSALLLFVVPLFAAWLAKKVPTKAVELRTKASSIKLDLSTKVGAERLDHSKIFCYLLGSILFLYSLYIPLSQNEFSFNFFTINYINLLLLSMALLAHGRFSGFLKAIDEAIGGAAGILIQFPLYFGILGIMKHSGLIDLISHFFTSISNQTTFPIFTFFSAGLVNFFVPSGGGQWSIQGPIIIQAAQELDLNLSKGIMAMAYGDQLTNMLQPFWALPLLGITGLKARDIIPYTLLIMVVGMILFLTGLILF
jgi:short-chain fatty acids transporter